jgi:hypothetical protein
MKPFKNIVLLMLLAMVLSCASSKNIDNKLPMELGTVYFQESSDDESKENLGITIFVPVIANVNNLKLDSIYFRGQQASLKFDKNVFVGQFKPLDDYKADLIMSNEPYAEYGNKVPRIPSKRSLELGKHEALVSYVEGNKTNYFKISNIIKKEL